MEEIMEDLYMEDLEASAKNCSLQFEQLEALNLTHDIQLISRLFNMCQYTWDPEASMGIYFWEELIPPLVIYM